MEEGGTEHEVESGGICADNAIIFRSRVRFMALPGNLENYYPNTSCEGKFAFGFGWDDEGWISIWKPISYSRCVPQYPILYPDKMMHQTPRFNIRMISFLYWRLQGKLSKNVPADSCFWIKIEQCSQMFETSQELNYRMFIDYFNYIRKVLIVEWLKFKNSVDNHHVNMNGNRFVVSLNDAEYQEVITRQQRHLSTRKDANTLLTTCNSLNRNNPIFRISQQFFIFLYRNTRNWCILRESMQNTALLWM